MMRVQSGFNGKRLKAARLYRGLTISEVAKMSDVSKQAISQFENSKAAFRSLRGMSGRAERRSRTVSAYS